MIQKHPVPYQINRRRFIHNCALATLGFSLNSFSLIGKAESKVRFGIVTDSHYANRDSMGTRFYRESLTKMEEFVHVMNSQEVDFIIHLGDLKDEKNDKNELDTLNYLYKIENVLNKFRGSIYHCVGNHDVDSITKRQFLTNITNTGINDNRSFYSFDCKNVHFVVLDANFDKYGKDHFFKENFDWQDTYIPNNELEWLINNLNETQFPTVIFCHHPLFKYPHNLYKYHVTNYLETQRVMEDSGKVIMIFQGHVHEEYYQKENNIHYATLYGMVDYSGLVNNSFSIVTIKNNLDIEINGYYRSSSKQLKHV